MGINTVHHSLPRKLTETSAKTTRLDRLCMTFSKSKATIPGRSWRLLDPFTTRRTPLMRYLRVLVPNSRTPDTVLFFWPEPDAVANDLVARLGSEISAETVKLSRCQPLAKFIVAIATV